MSRVIRIKMGEKEKLISLSQNMISKGSIKSAFLLPNDALVSLSYKLNGAEIFYEVHPVEPCFLLPDGWHDMEFLAESNKVPSEPGSSMKIGDGCPSSPYSEDLTKFDSYLRYLFYSRIVLKDNDGTIVEDVDVKYFCVPFYTTMISMRYFVISTRHGAHRCLEEGDEVNVYNSAHVPFKVKVVLYDDDLDFVLFESDVKLCDHTPIVGPIRGGRHYVMLGFKQHKKEGEHIEPYFASRITMSSQASTSGHVVGTSRGVSGLSGGPVFDLLDRRLIGICISIDDLDDRQMTSGRFSSDMITYCKEKTIVRILPVHDVAVIFHVNISEPKKPLKRRLQEEESE